MEHKMEYACKFENLSLSYGGENVLTGINGTLAQGNALALIGPNGSGKTTLLRSILRLCKVTSGKLTVLNSTNPQDYKHNIGYVPQVADLDPAFPITVKQVVMMGLYPRIGWFRLPKAKHKKAVIEALKKVDMLDKMNKKFGTLSGGQQQRILVARAFISKPKILLLDEPFNGLDQPNRKALLDIIDSLKKEKISIIVSTHDLDLAYAVCEKVLIVKNHQIAFGDIKDTLTGENIARAYGANTHEYEEMNLGNNISFGLSDTKKDTDEMNSKSKNTTNSTGVTKC